MTEPIPYRPRALNPKHQADLDAYYAPFELSWWVVDSVLPSGGKGFKVQHFWRGLPIDAKPGDTPTEMIAIAKEVYGQT